MTGWVYLGTLFNFFISALSIIGAGFLTLLIYMETPSILLPTLFFQIFPISLPRVSNYNPAALFVALFHWLNRWLCHIWCVILLNTIMDLHMLSLSTLVPKDFDVCFMKQGVTFTEVWHIMWLFASTLIWYHTDTQTKTHSTLRDQ